MRISRLRIVDAFIAFDLDDCAAMLAVPDSSRRLGNRGGAPCARHDLQVRCRRTTDRRCEGRCPRLGERDVLMRRGVCERAGSFRLRTSRSRPTRSKSCVADASATSRTSSATPAPRSDPGQTPGSRTICSVMSKRGSRRVIAGASRPREPFEGAYAMAETFIESWRGPDGMPPVRRPRELTATPGIIVRC